MVGTNAGGKAYICATPQPDDLTSVEYAGLTWIEIGGVGNFGETGNTTNILAYDMWATKVSQKGKGITNAGDPELEVARIIDDAGQEALAAAALTPFYYAFKIERNDAPAGGTPTTLYNRGLVVGPRTPNGRVEDFDLEIYTLGMVQEQIKVDAAAA